MYSEANGGRSPRLASPPGSHVVSSSPPSVSRRSLGMKQDSLSLQEEEEEESVEQKQIILLIIKLRMTRQRTHFHPLHPTLGVVGAQRETELTSTEELDSSLELKGALIPVADVDFARDFFSYKRTLLGNLEEIGSCSPV